MQNHWLKTRDKYLTIPLYLMAFTSPFSISLSQFFFALSLLTWFIDLLFLRVSGSITNPVWHSSLKPLLYAFIFWVLYRAVHLFLADSFLRELNAMREVWLMLAVPLVFRNLPTKNQIYWFFFMMLAGLMITSFFNIGYYITIGFDPNFRSGGFNNNNPLTYAGMAGMIFVIGIGLTMQTWQERKTNKNKIKFILALIMTALALIALLLARSSGVSMAVGFALVLYFMLILKRRAFYFMPILLLLPVLIIFSSKRVSQVWQETLSRKYPFTIQERIFIWQTGWSIWKENPVLGTSESDYQRLYEKHRAPNVSPEYTTAYKGSHQHNDFLNTLVLYGVVGFFIFLLFFILPLKHFWQWYQRQEKLPDYLLLALGSNIILFILMAMSQCHFTDEEVQLVLWMNIGLMYKIMEISSSDTQ